MLKNKITQDLKKKKLDLNLSKLKNNNQKVHYILLYNISSKISQVEMESIIEEIKKKEFEVFFSKKNGYKSFLLENTPFRIMRKFLYGRILFAYNFKVNNNNLDKFRNEMTPELVSLTNELFNNNKEISLLGILNCFKLNIYCYKNIKYFEKLNKIGYNSILFTLSNFLTIKFFYTISNELFFIVNKNNIQN